MRVTIKSYLTAIPLLAGFACPLAAATLGLSTNQHRFVPGDVLSLSGSIMSTSAGGVSSNIYLELVLPNGSLLTLDRSLAWKPSWSPIVGAIPLANLDAPNFYSTPLPAGLPEGTYSLYLIAVPAGANPANGSTWIASDKASFTYSAKAVSPDVDDTIRWLEQAAWGPNDTLIAHVQSLGSFAAYAAHYPVPAVAPDNSQTLCPTGSPASCYCDNYTQYPNQVAFFQHALSGGDPLRQRVAFALHQILVTSGVKIRQPAFMAPYLNLLLDDAFANYRQILEDVTLSPAMGNYLDMVNNSKPSADGKVKPNENYAREVMQLFTIGLNWLNADGSEQLDQQGLPIPTYDQTTVEGFAYTFTGWTYADAAGAAAAKFPNPHNYASPMVLYRNAKGLDLYHDKSAKTLLALTPGGKPQTLSANQDGLADLKGALDNLFSHPNIAPFIGKQLIQHLVTSNPSPAYVARVSAAFNAGQSHGFGSGKRGDMQATVAAVLLDTEARCGSSCAAGFGRLREPAQFIVNIAKAFNATSDGILNSSSSAMGQNVFDSPTVFNYFPHTFTVPGTSLQGPEFGIDASAEAIYRENFVNTLVFGHVQPPAPATGTQIDLGGLTALAATPAALIDRLDRLLLHGTMTAAMRATLLSAVNGIAASNPKSRAQTALYLVLASGQYQVQR